MSISKFFSSLAFIGVLFFVDTLFGAILSPDQRLEHIEKTKKIVGVVVVPFNETEAKQIGNPFSSERLPKVEVKKVAEVLDDKIILNGLSRTLVPDGVFQVNGEYIAIFGGKRIKSGDTIIRKYMDQEYEVNFDKLDNSAITIRYGKAQLRIKLK